MSGEITRVLITGANGFVGAALCEWLAGQGLATRAALRTGSSASNHLFVAQTVEVGDIHADTDWMPALAGVTHVVHLAARVHVMRESARDPLAEFRAVNTAGTVNLARQAAAAGLRRFIYVSTIKVNGERTSGRPFSADDIPQPEDAYAQSKFEAELALHEISRQSGMEVVVVRPPLVYGPGVRGNFLSMMNAVRRGMPLPLRSCGNRRSFIGLSNLVDLLGKCVTHPAAAGQVFLAADGEDLSTPELLRRVAHALDTKARLLPFPSAMLRFAARVVRHSSVYERLCGSLQVDAEKTRTLLGWMPPLTVDEELARTARWFLTSAP